MVTCTSEKDVTERTSNIAVKTMLFDRIGSHIQVQNSQMVRTQVIQGSKIILMGKISFSQKFGNLELLEELAVCSL